MFRLKICKGTGGLSNLHNDEFHNLYFSQCSNLRAQDEKVMRHEWGEKDCIEDIVVKGTRNMRIGRPTAGG
jgi:hypothetical protein